MPRLLALALLLVLAVPPLAAAQAASGADDVGVVAVVDGSFQPYHHDFLASLLPQHQDTDPGNDLPLGADPRATWLPGFPGTDGFASYGSLPLSLTDDPDATVASLQAEDQATWDGFEQSTGDAVHYRWFPGTKVIGAMTVLGGQVPAPTSDHGVGTSTPPSATSTAPAPSACCSSSSYGDDAGPRRAIEWAERSPGSTRSRTPTGSRSPRATASTPAPTSTPSARPTERGQTIFFSAGNGQENAFVTPNPTLLLPGGPRLDRHGRRRRPGADNYTERGRRPRPVLGHRQARRHRGDRHRLPRRLRRRQLDGVGSGLRRDVERDAGSPGSTGARCGGARAARRPEPRAGRRGLASGAPLACGSARPAASWATAADRRGAAHAPFEGAAHTGKGWTRRIGPAVGAVETPAGPANDEAEYLAVGHGYYAGREARTAPR